MNKLVAFAGVTGFLILWSALEQERERRWAEGLSRPPGVQMYVTPDGRIVAPFFGPSNEALEELGVLPLHEAPRAPTMRLDEVPRSLTVTIPRSAGLPTRQR